MKNQRRAKAKRVRAAGGVRAPWSRNLRNATYTYWRRQDISGQPVGYVTEAALTESFNACDRISHGRH